MANLFDILKQANPKTGSKPTAKNATPQKPQGKGPAMVNKPMRKSAGRGR